MKNRFSITDVFAFRVVSVSIAAVAAFAVPALSQAAPAFCNLPSVHRISVPLYIDRPGSKTFSYAYQIMQEYDPAKPTVIYLPGGPGDTSISNLDRTDYHDNFDLFWSGVPSHDWNVIFTDPRSAGCNYGDDQAFPDDSLTTVAFAHDVIGMIRSLNLKNYYLYGYSYGTALATVTASIAESEGIGPKGVVLAGTLSHATEDADRSWEGYTLKQWNLMKARLPEAVLRRLGTSAGPLGIPGDDWKMFINMGLRFGRMEQQPGIVSDWLYDQLMLLASNTSSDDQKFLASVQWINNYWGPDDPVEDKAEGRLWHVVGCHEVAHVDRMYGFNGGEGVLADKDNCAGTVSNTFYDVANWPIHANLYYFAGTNDPAVDYDIQQRPHFESETHANRFFVTLPMGGHNLLGEALGDCSDDLWSSFLQDGAGLEKVLSSCKDHPRLETLLTAPFSVDSSAVR